MNRCKNLGIKRMKPYLNPAESSALRNKIDNEIDNQIMEWNKNVPTLSIEDKIKEFNMLRYQRELAETAIRIRLLRVVESKAIAEIAKFSPEGAQKWAEYEADEMLHDEMFIDDLIRSGVSKEEFYDIEPTLATKLLVGFLSYLLDHEGPLGVVAYSYLVEYVNVKLESKRLDLLEQIIGRELIEGQLLHANTDIEHDHPGLVWETVRYIITSDNDIESFKKYLQEFQNILMMFFVEMNKKFSN